MDSATLDRLHATQIEILCEIDRICRLNNINYFLDSGTALGAIRHHGFIPWDDDVDIAMLREDYDKFCEIAPSCLKKDYFFQSLLSDQYYNKLHVKIRKNNTKYIESTGGCDKMHNGIFIDIVPFDKIPSRLGKLACFLAYTYQRMFVYNYEKATLKPNIFKSTISSLFTGRNTLGRYNKICKMYSRLKKNYSYVAFDYPDYQRFIFPAEIFSGTELTLFEEKEFPILKGYDAYLRIMYGDYMQLPPIEDRVTHSIIVIEL